MRYSEAEAFDLPDCDVRITLTNQIFGHHVRFKADLHNFREGIVIGITSYWPGGIPVARTKWCSYDIAMATYESTEAQDCIKSVHSALLARLSKD